jgi:15-cis-phytoene synthase
MIELYHNTSQKISKLITEMYSTSFTLGIKSLGKNLHTPIYSIYGFVRLADEIVDSFHNFDKRLLFSRFESETFLAIEEKISTNPVIHAFQMVVNEYQIDLQLVKSFLNSMKMDLDFAEYSDSKYNEYIHGSAEAVGLMCLKIFCFGDAQKYDSLQYAAKKLGAAFQKVNFLRDINADFIERGRIYFPNIKFENISETEKIAIENDIENDFKEAYKGLILLPKEAKFGVMLAYEYYLRLFHKIKKSPMNTIKTQRISIPNYQKLGLLFFSIMKKTLV